MITCTAHTGRFSTFSTLKCSRIGGVMTGLQTSTAESAQKSSKVRRSSTSSLRHATRYAQKHSHTSPLALLVPFPFRPFPSLLLSPQPQSVMCLTLHVCEWRLQVYSKDSSGKSVPKQLLPEAYKSATCRSVRTKRRCPRNVAIETTVCQDRLGTN
jgi:hypothetical protein